MILTMAMAHPRTLIRQAVIALLISANTAAGSRVDDTRVDPHRKSDLPAISVYTWNDPVNDEISSSTEETHELDVEIWAWVTHTSAVPAAVAMDNIAEQIENAIKADPTLAGEASDARLAGTELEIAEENGASSPLVGIVRMTYVVTYRSSLVAEDPAGDFLSVDAKHKRTDGGADTAIAEDVFVVQEPSP